MPLPPGHTHHLLGSRCGDSTWSAVRASWWMSWVWWIAARLETASSLCLPRRCSTPGSRRPRACPKEVRMEQTPSFPLVFETFALGPSQLVGNSPEKELVRSFEWVALCCPASVEPSAQSWLALGDCIFLCGQVIFRLRWCNSPRGRSCRRLSSEDV